MEVAIITAAEIFLNLRRYSVSDWEIPNSLGRPLAKIIPATFSAR